MPILSYVRSHKLIVGALIIVAIGIYYYTNKESPSQFEVATVTIGDVVQEVSVTGKVQSSREVELSFEKGGKVVQAPVAVGDRVEKGALLARIDSSEIEALRAQAEANLRYELAQLDQLKVGARKEDIAVSQTKIDSAKSALEDARRGLIDKLENAYTQADDAVRNKVDVLLKNPRTSNPELLIPVVNAQLATTIPPRRVALEKLFSVWATDSLTVGSSADMVQEAEITEQRLSQVKEYLDVLALSVNSLVASSEVNQTTIDTWKLNVSNARTNLNTAMSNVIAADEKYRAAARALVLSESELSFKIAGATPESIRAQEAKISSVRATVANYDAQISKYSLRAPFSGVVTKQEAKVGKSVAQNSPVVTLISDGVYEIVANVPEVDIAKIKLGDSASVTLDAYGDDEKFLAVISKVDPAETVIEGVPTYEVTIQFLKQDIRIRSGMTANVVVDTAKKEGVLMIPARSVYTREGVTREKFVRVPTGTNTSKEVIVTLGLRGSNGMMEVVTGLQEGDSVITADKGQQ